MTDQLKHCLERVMSGLGSYEVEPSGEVVLMVDFSRIGGRLLDIHMAAGSVLNFGTSEQVLQSFLDVALEDIPRMLAQGYHDQMPFKPWQEASWGNLSRPADKREYLWEIFGKRALELRLQEEGVSA